MEPFYISLKKSIAEAHRMEEKWEGTLDPIFNNSITINNMNFSYPTKSVLSNLSMVIPKNSFIALMGESGGGKTTFSDILCALYMPDSGEILVDGQNLNELDLKKWRRIIGYVPQDLFLFHDTIMHNVNLGNLRISEEDVVKALKDSGAWEFVSELPEGIKTVIGERGIRLSGGQRQRLSIARAIVRKPQLLILDEATTALDPATEERILRTLRKLTDQGITIVAVSHQMAVLDIADQVYNLENGRFEEVNSTYPNKILN
jgi:ATP-binding cassette subfamily C protein